MAKIYGVRHEKTLILVLTFLLDFGPGHRGLKRKRVKVINKRRAIQSKASKKITEELNHCAKRITSMTTILFVGESPAKFVLGNAQFFLVQ
jgi:hypothetical protein